MKPCCNHNCDQGRRCSQPRNPAKARAIRCLWLFIFCFAATALSMLSGCVKREEVRAAEVEQERSPISIYVDGDTGCEYASASGRGITPRMGRDGKQICREVKP